MRDDNRTLPLHHEGTLTLQLHNARTGKLEYQETIKNFASKATYRRMEWEIRGAYHNGLVSIAASVNDKAPKSPFGAIVLTDSTLPEDASNEWMMPGKTIGWANGTAYAGIDTLRGTPSITELDAQETYTKWVYTWPDIAANGTIGSVGFCNAYDPTVIPNGPRSMFPLTGTIEQKWATTVEWYYFARASSSLSFAHDGGTGLSVVRLDGDYAPTLASFSVFPYFTRIRGLAWDSAGQFLWVIGESNANKVIAKFDSDGVLQEGPYNTTNRDHRYLAFDGTNLWSTTQAGGTMTAWCINPSNGNDINNFAYDLYVGQSGQYVCGLCWEPTYQRLWVRTTMSAYDGYNSSQSFYYLYNRATLLSFNTSGEEQTPEVSLWGYNLENASHVYLSAQDTNDSARYHDFDVIDAYQFALPAYSTALGASPYRFVVRFRPDGMATRARLSTPVTKNNTQTLKVVYQVDYSV